MSIGAASLGAARGHADRRRPRLLFVMRLGRAQVGTTCDAFGVPMRSFLLLR